MGNRTRNLRIYNKKFWPLDHSSLLSPNLRIDAPRGLVCLLIVREWATDLTLIYHRGVTNLFFKPVLTLNITKVTGTILECNKVQTDYGVHPASCPKANRGLFSKGWSGRSVDLITHLHIVPRPKVVKLQHQFLTHLNGIMVLIKYRDNLPFW